jgi:hypothetical protein
MNEKIKELAERYNFPMGNTDPQWHYEDAIYKFAELIILECSELCYTSHLEDGDAHAMNILDHFDIDGAKHWK